MAEEFQESDVVFSDHYNNDNDNNCELLQEKVLSNNNSSGRMARGTSNKKNVKKKISSAAVNSVPVNINIPADNRFQYVDREDQFEEEYDEDGEIVPPHVIVARRIAGKMAFSVCASNGRTLKGRDLSQLRNSILRMTGFLET